MRAVLLILIVFSAGCGNQVYYDEQQFANRTECYQLPLSQREECIKKTHKTFAEYDRERKALIDE